jgi:hypothetical protein
MPSKKKQPAAKKPRRARHVEVHIDGAGYVRLSVRSPSRNVGSRSVHSDEVAEIIRDGLAGARHGVLTLHDAPTQRSQLMAVGRREGVILVSVGLSYSNAIASLDMCGEYRRWLGLQVGQVRFCTVEAA